jgi:hypothetical protein
MTEAAADDMLGDPRQQQRRRVRVPKPVWSERGGHPALQHSTQPADLPGDSLRPHRCEPRLAREVHEHPPAVEIADRDVGAGVAQPPQVLAVEAIELVGDVDAPVATFLTRSPCG